MFVCHFADPELRDKKEGTKESEHIYFETVDCSTCCTLLFGVEENFTQSLSAFFVISLVTKKMNSFLIFS